MGSVVWGNTVLGDTGDGGFQKTFEWPEPPDLEDWIYEMMDSQNDSWKEYVEDPKEIEAELAEFREKKKLCNQELLSVVEHALADMPNLTPSARFIPQTFDQRFAGKDFIVKGDLDGYEEGQVKDFIEKFGGGPERHLQNGLFRLRQRRGCPLQDRAEARRSPSFRRLFRGHGSI